jgi:hypothetical protein
VNRPTAGKYAPLVPVLAGLITRPDTPLQPDVKARVLSQLAHAQERFAVITGAAATNPPGPARDTEGR